MSFRLTRCFICVLSLIIFANSRLWSQKERVQEELNARYKRKSLILRNFYTENDLTYDQRGTLQDHAFKGSWTLASMKLSRIAIVPDGITIDADRMGTVYGGKIGTAKGDIHELGKMPKAHLVNLGKVKIHVEKKIEDGDTVTAIRPIFESIFVRPDEDLRPMLPDYWEGDIKTEDSRASEPTPEKLPSKVVKPPRVVYSPDPTYTREASKFGLEGTSVLTIVVNPNGTADRIVIVRPLGLGLDEQAVDIIRRWKFQPATKEGQPVSVRVTIEVSFRCCH